MADNSLTRQIERVELDYLTAADHLARLPALIEKRRRSPLELEPAQRRVTELAEVLKTMRWLGEHEAAIREWIAARGAA